MLAIELSDEEIFKTLNFMMNTGKAIKYINNGRENFNMKST